MRSYGLNNPPGAGGGAHPSVLPNNASRCAADVALSCVPARKTQISDEVERGNVGGDGGLSLLAVVQTAAQKTRRMEEHSILVGAIREQMLAV